MYTENQTYYTKAYYMYNLFYQKAQKKSNLLNHETPSYIHKQPFQSSKILLDWKTHSWNGAQIYRREIPTLRLMQVTNQMKGVDTLWIIWR